MNAPLRFIVDAQLPPALAAFLRDKGHEAVALREIGLRDADDPDIWERARLDAAVIVTKDEDFAQLVAANDGGPRVLWVRTGNLLKRVLLARFESAWSELEQHLRSGARLVELR
jgi:predicted nuclease of predicted toxin-antitoxin system